MYSIFKRFIISLTILMLLSCSKEDNDAPRVATIKIVHLIEGFDNVIVKTDDDPINYALVIASPDTKAKVSFENFKNFSIEEGVNKNIVIVSESDTLNAIYSEKLNLVGIHSLYLSGTLEAPTQLFVEDNFKQFTDSIVGIRFINLSKSSGPINIGIEGQTSTIVSGLAYNTISDYIEFPAKEADGSYIFEFGDSSGGMGTRTFLLDPLDADDVSVKRNLTLAIIERASFFGALYKFTRFNNY